MLKKYEKIIKSVLNPKDERFANVYLSPDTGFYYATDGYRMIRFSGQPNELPVKTEGNILNMCTRTYEIAADTEYSALEIPYYLDQIKAWHKENKKSKKNLPFKLGVQVQTSVGKHYIAINPKFLIEAMEITGSNTIMIPKTGQGLLILGNGFEWIIMPVVCKDFESDKHMTEIQIAKITYLH